MVFKVALAALAATAQLAMAKPGEAGMRLIKTSEEKPATWMTDKDIYALKGEHVGFIDITDIKDPSFVKALSTKPKDRVTHLKAAFPTELSHIEEANTLIGNSNTDGPQSNLNPLASYKSRHCQSETGTEAAAWLFEKVTEVGSANPSIIARIPGKNENLVIIGAHFDSTTGEATDPAPGADDNASGTVVVLESLRVLAEAGFAPENTVEFHFYAGEEIGLVGSAAVFESYASQGKNIVSYLNQDMTGYQPSGTPCIIEDYTDAGLNDYLAIIVEEYTGKAPNRDECGYGCSDHASADANGFPAAFLFEDMSDKTSPYIHTVNDVSKKKKKKSPNDPLSLTKFPLVPESFLPFANLVSFPPTDPRERPVGCHRAPHQARHRLPRRGLLHRLGYIYTPCPVSAGNTSDVYMYSTSIAHKRKKAYLSIHNIYYIHITYIHELNE